ncbi:hypothetical protein [Archaeoglobus fulgidus]|uniref:hypothetical protein n=1 Tax=Archaeoglobus fulgidus TaxID=2234 RepID=UPI00117842DC|nr:hypothetical protein [Archaeoglobus fulgidus]
MRKAWFFLPKQGAKEIPKLRSEVGLPSSYFGEQRKDNPIAKNARFRVDNVVPDLEKPIEVYVNEKKVAEIAIRRRN